MSIDLVTSIKMLDLHTDPAFYRDGGGCLWDGRERGRMVLYATFTTRLIFVRQ